MKKESNAAALLPIVVFLIFYLGSGIYFEYIHPVEGGMGFYIMSAVVAFMFGLVVAFIQNRDLDFDEKIKSTLATRVRKRTVPPWCFTLSR